jgi:hypothetical protein
MFSQFYTIPRRLLKVATRLTACLPLLPLFLLPTATLAQQTEAAERFNDFAPAQTAATLKTLSPKSQAVLQALAPLAC